MLIRVAMICVVCLALGAAAPGLRPAEGGALERFLLFGAVPTFLVKLSQGQERYAKLIYEHDVHRMTRPDVFERKTTAPAYGTDDCCYGIPPWHIINSSAKAALSKQP